MSLVHLTHGAERASLLEWPGVASHQKDLIHKLLSRGHEFPSTTSAGRLFDGMASLVLGISHADFEGQAAMLLEAVCDNADTGTYSFPIAEGELLRLDWRPLLAGILGDMVRSIDPARIAMRFHRSLARGIADMARPFAELPLVLCGGCFQNRVLTELVLEMLEGHASSVATPGVIPTGDGGLAAGQLAVAAERICGGSPCA
jgi:hydrogenase maturation protein HypF